MTPKTQKPLPEDLPAPSYAPPVLAVGLMCLLWGLVSTWILCGIGLVIMGIASILWVSGLRPRATAGPTVADIPQPRRGRLLVSPVSGFSGLGLDSPWLHRLAITGAVCGLALLISGALVTSAGKSAPGSLQIAHVVLGAVAGVVAAGLTIGARRPGGLLLGAIILEAVLGSRAPGLAALHALLAQSIFAGMVVMSLLTSSSWRREPAYADDMTPVSLRVLGLIAVAMLLMQIALGAAVRHKVMSSGWHITFALVVALTIVCLGVLVMNHLPEHRPLRPLAVTMMVITGAQVFLGFGAFIVRMMADENNLPLMITTVAHVTTGALTLAATVVLALQLRRHLRPAAAAQKDAVVT